MKTEKILLAVTVLAASALTRFRMVSHSGGVPGLNGPVLGVANADYDEGEQAGVAVQGEILVESGGPVSVGQMLATDAQGRAIRNNAGGKTCGIARDDASGTGEIIRMIAVASGSTPPEV